MIRGIDVSHWQGPVNWNTLKASQGLAFGMCKATEGLSFLDGQFARNWANIRAAGLTRIAYHFGRPGISSGRAQAARFLDVVRPRPGDVLCLDLETGDGRSQSEVNAWAREFGIYLRQYAEFNSTVLYAGAGYVANGTGRGLAAVFDWWMYPRYPKTNTTKWPSRFNPVLPPGLTVGWKAPHIWQWSSTQATPAGRVDANVSTLTTAQLRSRAGTVPTKEDIVTPEDIKAIAKEVVTELLGADRVGAPTPKPDNPTYTVESALEWTLRRSAQSYAILASLAPVIPALAKLADIDADQLAADFRAAVEGSTITFTAGGQQ